MTCGIFHSLEEIRGCLFSYVQRYNQPPPTHPSMESPPQDRFFSEPEQIRRLPGEELERSFLLEVGTQGFRRFGYRHRPGGIRGGLPLRQAARRLRYSPNLQEIYVVEPDGTLTPVRLLNKQENALVKRDKVRLWKGDE